MRNKKKEEDPDIDTSSHPRSDNKPKDKFQSKKIKPKKKTKTEDPDISTSSELYKEFQNYKQQNNIRLFSENNNNDENSPRNSKKKSSKKTSYVSKDIDKLTGYQEKEYDRLKREYENSKKNKSKFVLKNPFKKTKNKSNYDTNISIEDEYEKRLNYESVENKIKKPKSCFKGVIGIPIAAGIITFIVLFVIIIANIKGSQKEPEEKYVLKHNFTHIFLANKFRNEKFTKDEIKYIKENITLPNINEQMYVDLCLQGILLQKIPNQISNKPPNISVIKPVYKGVKYLNYSLRSIQNQVYTDYEIIIVDDNSPDNDATINKVKEFQKEDSRIKLIQIKNKERGLLYSFSIGILNAKGKYIMELDQDDLFIQPKLFSELYLIAEKNNYDIIKFWGIEMKDMYRVLKNRKQTLDGPVLNEEDLKIACYRMKRKNYLENGMVWDKFVKTDVYQNAVQAMGEKYYGKYIFCFEDFMLIFMLFRKAKSLKEYGRFGHLKFKHDDSVSAETSVNLDQSSKDQNVYEAFTYLEMIYEYSEDNARDKNLASLDLLNVMKYTKERISYRTANQAMSVFQKYMNSKDVNFVKKGQIAELYDYVNKKFNQNN